MEKLRFNPLLKHPNTAIAKSVVELQENSRQSVNHTVENV